ncbi:MAG: metallophosphoesterase [Bacteroidia bacterium]
MKIQYCSDLHLEFRENWNYLKSNPIKPTGDILLLAGDIVPFAEMNKYDEFFTFVSDHFEYVYWVPGNHEYYHFNVNEKSGTINEKIKSNVFLVNNTTVCHGNINFIFSTLWSHISPQNQWQIEKNTSDFRCIKYNNNRLSSEHFNKLHDECLAFLTGELKKNNANSIVVTHHVPTLLNYPEIYKGDNLNEAFVVELFDLIEGSKASHWIFGHHHINVPEFKIGATNLLTNQLGYVKYNEHISFNTHKII